MSAASPERMTAQERRHAIVTAAQPLFAAKGVDGVTTREVAEAAGVSEALLYRHFDGKAALYGAVLESCIHHATVDARLIDSLPDDTATLVLAVYLVMRNIEIGAGAGGAQRDIPPLMLRSLLSDGQFARDFIQTAASHFLSKLERCVRAGIAKGEIEGEQDEVVTAGWFAHHLAAAVVFFRLPGPVVDYPIGSDPERLLELSVRFVLRGLGLRKDVIERHYQPAAFALLRGDAARP